MHWAIIMICRATIWGVSTYALAYLFVEWSR